MSTNYTNEDELNQMMDNDDNTRSSSYQSQSILTGSSGSSGLNDYSFIHPYPSSTSSADDTSQTSLSQLQDESSLVQSGLSDLTIRPPQRYESDFDGLGWAHAQTDHIPQELEIDLGGQHNPTPNPLTAAEAQTTKEPFDRTLLGITNPTASPLSSPSVELDMAMTQVWSTFRHVTSDPPYIGENILKGLSDLETLKQLFLSKYTDPAPSTTTGSESRKKTKEAHQCMICEAKNNAKKTYNTFGSLKRHFGSIHGIADRKYRCLSPHCDRDFLRRDRAREHMIYTHKMHDMKDLAAARRKVAPPCICPACPQIIQSWERYWEHVKVHCTKHSPAASVMNGGDKSRRGGGREGGSGPNRGSSSFAEPSNAYEQSRSHQGDQPSDSNNYRTYQGGHMNRARETFQPSMILPVSDDKLSLAHPPGLDAAAGEFSMNDVFDEAQYDPDFHFAGGIHQRFDQSQNPQTPWFSPTDQSSQKPQKRKRSTRKQAAPKQATEQRPSSIMKCTGCGHVLSTCRQCQYLTESVGSCHNCPSREAIAAQAMHHSALPSQDRQRPLSTLVTLDPYYLQPSLLQDFSLFPMGADQHPYPSSNWPMQYPGGSSQRQSFDSEEYDGSDDFLSRPPFIGMTMVDENHGCLLNVDNKPQSPVLDHDYKLLRSVGLGSPIKPLTLLSNLNQAMKQASIGLSSEMYTELPFRQREPLRLQSSKATPGCQCPCVILPVVKYSAHASARLSDSERVEMTFKMSPAARESNHPLRTRVRVFVKLFKLRASVLKTTANDKERHQLIQQETALGGVLGSDTDSDHAISPISPSDSELAPVLSWTEDVQDWSFEFDLEWAVSRFSQMTSGITADTYLKHFSPNPGRILDLISMYILHEFEICWSLGLDRVRWLLMYLMISCSSSTL
ncbi:hypothetical protein MYU51_005415 [Penicillium brevicompactum]|uniref:uncharacterized protein n=1 Tax=Penicillium brevicompactum TaxID=5074 RepID=UPI002540EA45|nr:uncharacterized protein N7506_004521 [Penicillium brevicompactum]KAJ5336499.1 hypothetical protein N7506_004521 [Penicillium brevicompactum]